MEVKYINPNTDEEFCRMLAAILAEYILTEIAGGEAGNDDD